MIRPKKNLGQHFLKDHNIAKKIVDSLKAEQTPLVIEIGPGKGVLTQFLIHRASLPLHLIELDYECIEFLKNAYPSISENIYHQDFLKFNIQDYFKDEIAIIGNFPYNISSQIFFKILENKNQVTEVVGMVQKEVAERICSNPGNKTYGILSVLLQAYYNIQYLFTVKPGVFYPPPKVNSAVIRLTRNDNLILDCDESLFFRVVKTSFNQRRKTLRNSLKSIIINDIPDPIFTKRPEQLNYTEFIYLTNLISKSIK